MKILITSDFYEPLINGVVHSLSLLAGELTKRGHEVRFLTLSSSPRSRSDGKVCYLASFGMGMIYPNVRIKLPGGRKLIRELIGWKPDVVHSQCEFSTFGPAKKIAKACGAPLVHTSHTVYEDYTHYYLPIKPLARFLLAIFFRSITKKTDCVVVPTKKIEDLLRSYKVKQRIKVMPSGIDLSLYTSEPPEQDREKLRRSLGIPDGNKVCVYIGRLGKEKSLEEIIEDIAALKRSDISLVIVGDGPYREKIERTIRKCGSDAILTGMIEHEKLGLYYRLGDLFVSASRSETQGLTYDEALACGVPALCRADRCLDGVVINGVNGWQYKDRSEFASKLEELLSDPEKLKQMGRNAAAGAYEFSSEKFALSAEELYKELIAEKKQRS